MKKLLFVLAAVTFVMAGCGPSTEIVRSWRDPTSSAADIANGKVLVIGLIKDESSRRIVEDNLVSRLNVKSVPSYSIFTERVIREAKDDELENHLADYGYTNIIMVRLAEIEKESNFVPGTMGMGMPMGGMGMGMRGGMGMNGFYGPGTMGMWGAGMWGTQGHYTTDKNYFFEIAVYSLNPNKLMWSGTTKSVNPGKMTKTIKEIGNAVTEQMQKDGFLPK
jgi:hypothetical protein